MWISPEAPNRSGIRVIAQVKLPDTDAALVAELAKHGKMWFWYQDIFFRRPFVSTAPDKDARDKMQTLKDLLYTLNAVNFIDIGIMACLVYFIASRLQGTRAFEILATLFGLGLFYLVASWFGLILTSVIFQYLWAAIIIVLVIVFQPEIREILDRASPIRYLRGRQNYDVEPDLVDELVAAVAELIRLRLGALIVFQRGNRLGDVIIHGKVLDGVVSADALVMIFQKTSPLHDGAVLISNGRIKSAGCILPLSKDQDLASTFGTRHRAAVGLTERTDAFCVVVSEERGEVSVVENREITNFKKKGEFRSALERGFARISNAEQPARSGILTLILSNWRMKVLSAGVAFFLWFIVVGPQRSEVGMSVPIQYTNLPSAMEITGQWMDRIDLRLRGSEAGLANLNPGSVRAIVDLSTVVPGLNCFRLTEKSIQVPPGITISQIRPSDLYLNIEAASAKKMTVVPTIVGKLAENTKVVVTPPEVMVKALQGNLRRVASITTEPVNAIELHAKGRILVPVIVKPDGLRVDSIDPIQINVSIEAEK